MRKKDKSHEFIDGIPATCEIEAILREQRKLEEQQDSDKERDGE